MVRLKDFTGVLSPKYALAAILAITGPLLLGGPLRAQDAGSVPSDATAGGAAAPNAPNSPAISTAAPDQQAPSTTSTTPAAENPAVTTEGASSYSAGSSAVPITGPGATAVTNSGPPVAWTGRVPFHITAALGETYDDNILIQPHKVSDWITTLSVRPELRFGDPNRPDGNYLDFYYQATGLIYASHSGDDSLNHSVDLFYQHRFSRLVLSLEQSYVHAESTNAALGSLVTSDVYNTALTADYAYSDRFDVRATGSQNFTNFDTSGYTSTREWDGDLYFLYHVDNRLSLGLGPRFGFLDIQGAPNQTYQQVLGRLDYEYSNRVDFNLDGGAEIREYQHGVPGDSAAPVFDVAANYRPSPFTLVTLAGARRYTPSYNFIGQDYISTSIAASISQMFYERFTFRLALGYENDDYQAAASGQNATREDNYFFVNPSLDYHPTSWLVLSLYYRYQRDDSNTGAYSFNDNQAGISLSATY